MTVLAHKDVFFKQQSHGICGSHVFEFHLFGSFSVRRMLPTKVNILFCWSELQLFDSSCTQAALESGAGRTACHFPSLCRAIFHSRRVLVSMHVWQM